VIVPFASDGFAWLSKLAIDMSIIAVGIVWKAFASAGVPPAAPPDGSVADLAARHHVSVRTVQRLFTQYVGIGPKWVMQRYRLHDALERLDRRRRQDWTRFALDLGYYDHAHFLRDFRSLVGLTPAAYESQTLSG
jgi:AraC-like DNA-binding protein